MDVFGVFFIREGEGGSFGIVTLLAFVWLFSTVRFQMSPQIACLWGCKVTLVAFVWLFSTVRFQMCSQMACTRRGIVTLVAFVCCSCRGWSDSELFVVYQIFRCVRISSIYPGELVGQSDWFVSLSKQVKNLYSGWCHYVK